MKKYLFLAMALLGLASCAKDDIANGNNPIHNGEIEESYIAINLSASDVTRAEGDPVFDDGEAAERAVNHVDFFFFDESGNPFNVVGNPAVAPGGSSNCLRATDVAFTKDGDETDNDDISDTSSPVLLLQTYKGQYPSQIVAVLNWSPISTLCSLDELYTAVNITSSYNGKDYFVMSNAVYASNGIAVNATALPESCIKKTKEEALGAPISIYVERVAAKVTVSTNHQNNIINLKKPVDGMTHLGELVKKDVYAKLLGWELYNDNTKSHLLKQITPSWTADDIGFNWNDAPWYRSYWATSLDRPTGDDNSFQMTYSDYVNAGFDNQYGFEMGGATYVGENTNGKDKGTKVILKAQLVEKDGDGYKPIEIASWYGNKYIGEESLRTAVANTLKYTYFAKDGEGNSTTYTGLKPEDLQCVAGGEGAPVKANEVYFQLSDDGDDKNWYKLVNGEYKPVADTIANDPNSVKATNEALKSVPAAVLYTNGETFYYVDIKHLGAPKSVAEYGVVRNHIYNIIINSIGGYGSPVYIGHSNLITPEYPQVDAEETFVSAQINILSWRLVSQTVDIQPNN